MLLSGATKKKSSSPQAQQESDWGLLPPSGSGEFDASGSTFTSLWRQLLPNIVVMKHMSGCVDKSVAITIQQKQKVECKSYTQPVQYSRVHEVSIN